MSRWGVKIVQTTNMKKYGHCVECVKCFWCSPFLCGCVPLMVGDNVEMSNMDIEPLRYWVIKYSNTKCVHTFIHFVYDPFIFTMLLQSRLSLSKEMKCYIYIFYILYIKRKRMKYLRAHNRNSIVLIVIDWTEVTLNSSTLEFISRISKQVSQVWQRCRTEDNDIHF